MTRLLILLALAACSGGGKSSGGTETTNDTAGGGFDRDVYRCTPPAGVDGTAAAAECEARADPGCKYSQQLSCYGTPPPPDVEEAEREARESGAIACACVCEADVVACSQVP